MKFQMDSMPGMVSATQYLLAPNGEQYQYFWCSRWVIITDEEVPTSGDNKFRSSERWFLAAMVGDHAVFVLPGCKVASWAHCVSHPGGERPVFYALEKGA